MDRCIKLKEFMDSQVELMKAHLDEHAWFNGIANKDQAAGDFLKRYGWLIREMYCSHSCEAREGCTAKNQYVRIRVRGKST